MPEPRFSGSSTLQLSYFRHKTVPRRSPSPSIVTRPPREAIHDVSVEVSVVLGKAAMPIHQLLKMGRGAIIEFEATVEDDAWIYANNRLIARGEVVIVGDHIAVSITDTMRSFERSAGGQDRPRDPR